MSEEENRFSGFQKFSFGLGSYAQWFVNGAFNTWVFSFYYVAVGLPVFYIMLAFILWTIWNACNDPLIGYLSDRTHTRIGRRKPYIILGTIPVLIIELIIWMPPTGSHMITFIYLLIMLMCFDTFYSMIALPYDSLFPELYNSVEERSQVNTIKQVLATLGLISAFLIPGMFIGNLANKTGYLINGIVTTIIVGTVLAISIIFGVKEREEFQLDYKQEFGFIEGLKYTMKNKGFVIYTLMFFLYEYILLVIAAIIPLYAEHVLHVENTFQTSLLAGMMFIVGVLTVLFWAKLDVKVGSKKGYAISMICYVIATIPLLFISTWIAAFVVVIFMGFGFGGMLYFIYLIIADVIDEDELKTGVRREGTFFGITNFFMRLAMVLSIVTISLVFTSTGWESYSPTPGTDVILGIKLIIVLFPALAIVATLILLYFYPYPKERVEEIKKELTKLHQTKIDRVKSQ